MSKDFLGLGWKFPVKAGASGKIAISKFDENVKESILIILSTAKGERVMRPTFGCGIHDMVFETINMSTLSLIESAVRESLTNYEPRIDTLSVKVSAEAVDQGKLIININYTVRATNNQFNIVYPFYLSEGK